MVIPLSLAIPPVRGGVWDYTHSVAERLGAAARVVQITREYPDVLDGKSVLLQYSGYGYAKRGAPLWLLKEIRARRRRLRTLGVFFHELYAVGPPWSSAFWLSPAQRYVARRLVEISDFWLASCEAYGEWLRRFGGHKPHAVLPVSSNVGELADCPERRRRAVVVFGGAPLREFTYRTAGTALFSWIRAQGLELHDLGPPLQDGSLQRYIREAGAAVHGRVESAPASRLLSEMQFGVIAYRGDALAKSGVFAAYCAHGLCPVVLANQPVTLDGLQSGRNYHAEIPSDDLAVRAARAIGKSAWAWYQSHRLECHAAAVRRLVYEQEGRGAHGSIDAANDPEQSNLEADDETEASLETPPAGCGARASPAARGASDRRTVRGKEPD